MCAEDPELAARYDAAVKGLRAAAEKELEPVYQSEMLTEKDLRIVINARDRAYSLFEEGTVEE